MRAGILVGVMTLSALWWAPATAQVSNSPLYQPSPASAAPSWPAWQGVQDGRSLAPSYNPAPRYPTDSRNLTLDNRAPNLWPAGPGLRDSTTRQSDGLRAPGAAEPGRPSWR